MARFPDLVVWYAPVWLVGGVVVLLVVVLSLQVFRDRPTKYKVDR